MITHHVTELEWLVLRLCTDIFQGFARNFQDVKKDGAEYCKFSSGLKMVSPRLGRCREYEAQSMH